MEGFAKVPCQLTTRIKLRHENLTQIVCQTGNFFPTLVYRNACHNLTASALLMYWPTNTVTNNHRLTSANRWVAVDNDTKVS